MRVQQAEAMAVVNLSISHHLIDICLRDPLLRIIDARGNSLPFGVDDLHDFIASLHQDIRPGLKNLTTIGLVLEAEETSPLKADAISCAFECALEQAPYVLFEQRVHFKKKGEAVLQTHRTRLKPVAEKKPG